MIKKILQSTALLSLVVAANVVAKNNCEARSAWVPRQNAYDPVLANALNYHKKNIFDDDWKYFLSANAYFSKSTGKELDTYFNIDNKPTLMACREDGRGDIDSLWFKVISSINPFTFYSANLSMHPERTTLGALLALDVNFSKNYRLEIFTSVLHARHKVNFCEKFAGATASVQAPYSGIGILDDFRNIAESFASKERSYGKICAKTLTKTGLDDIQVKFAKFCKQSNSQQSFYALLGIPTGSGTESIYLFEPLVGSKHLNLGFGATFDRNMISKECYNIEFMGEFKYRYGVRGEEIRSFDLTKNGQWSRYMLAVNKSDKNNPYFLINNLSLKADVTPKSNIDLWLAINYCRNCKFNLEVGYNLYFRQKEKVELDCKCTLNGIFGVADLVGIAKGVGTEQSASTANISQSVEPGGNQIKSDTEFVAITPSDLNVHSATQPQVLTNKVYLSLGHSFCWCNRDAQVNASVSYEHANDNTALSQVAFWAGLSVLF